MRAFLALLSVLTACRAPSAGDPVTPDAAIAPGPDAALNTTHCTATDPRAPAVEIVATPEAGEQPYIDALTAATTSIDVMIYEMGYGGILDTLKAKATAGVPVRVLFDQSEISVNQKYYDQLAAAGAQVKWSDPKFTYQHAKFFVVDHAVAVVSTGNFSKDYSIDLERNFVATDRDPADVGDLVNLFAADWANVDPAMSCTRMVISPINSRSRILDVINSATQTLTIESMQFADTQVRAAVAAKVAAGVNVRVMIADVGFVSANAYASTYLKGLGLDPRQIPHLHTKVIVADGTQAYVGSENLSQTSLDHNREVGVVVTDSSSIDPLSATFEKDWAIGTEF
ncbi:MAG TPA: phospholipase D-like domain-containing protein [Kofleriaceae bacterium]